MEDDKKLSRRNFLRFSAIGAATAMIAACGGQSGTQQGGAATTGAGGAGTGATSAAGGGGAAGGGQTAAGGTTDIATAVPAAKPASFKESPKLTELVKAGKLPALEQRLPKNPYVVPHKWLTPGKYGGVMHQSSFGTDDWNLAHLQIESMYGHSPLRWLKDGLEIGPGWVESWQSNADTSQWTFHIRDGLKWSDGQPFGVDDILFYWEDLANDPDIKDTIGDEFKSGKGTLAQVKKVDNITFQMIFDAPSPLVADRMAMWVNGWEIGPRWIAPKHYGQQFHKKYNANVPNTTAKPWYTEIKNKLDFGKNPDVPVMTGWKLTSYTQGQQSTWERNPYCWCVDKDGNQLPYIDTVKWQHFQDQQVQKLNTVGGKDDFQWFAPFALSDVSTLKQASAKNGTDVHFWDSGSGTASIAFFSYDYFEPKLRDLFRKPEFRQAMSYAYNRENARKVIYYNTGEPTTGTLSPKAIEYHINDQGKQVYQQWRDSYVKFDPEKAKALLDKIGCKVGSNGMRTLPDGSPLAIRLDQHADASSEHQNKNQLLAKDWQAVGVDTKINPIPPASFDDQWKAGKLMIRCDWEVGDGPNHLVYPQWLVPLEFSRWAPLHGSWYGLLDRPADLAKAKAQPDPYKRNPPAQEPEPGSAIDQLWKIYRQAIVEPDFMKRNKLVWDMIKIHVDQGPFFMGTVANYPRIVVNKTDLKNVPKREDLGLGGFGNPWIHPTPAVYDIETFYWADPTQHTV